MAIAAGMNFTLALKTNGAVFGWGANGNNQLDIPLAARSGVKAIAAGCESLHAVVLKTDGSVIAWGARPSHTAKPMCLSQHRAA
jgi:alpha-tubulin suppressor-like RCC1 family protein